MSSQLDDFAHLRIPLEDILSATNNFAEENIWGEDDFGNSYRGQLVWSGELIKIDARRFNKEWSEREHEFWMEIFMLSSLKHKNLVSLVGFCDENDEKIIITKFEIRGSLVNHLSDSMLLTWVRRLEICVGLARALSYIHYDEQRDFSVIHRNIDSETVLLNDNWEPELCEFRLSKKIKASERHHSFHVDKVWDREGYTDPAYIETKTVSHKSDIYSLGIVMFELLCGRKSIIPDASNKYLAPASFNVFIETAYACLNEEQSQRPDIDEIVTRLEKALELACVNKHNDEKVIIIRRETRGRLNQYLSDPMLLTWVRRLEISVGFAHALSYIHYDEQRNFSVIHRLIGKGRVLLNDDWEPKLRDFECSIKIKASKRHQSFHTNNPMYVEGYGDPTYIETKSVSHKSDMESIIDNKDDNLLAPLAITHYREKKLNNIVDPELWKQIDLHSFNMFAEIAYECLAEERSRRPNIDDIVPRLEKALELARENRPW
ncbi:protein kinase-like domain-containing protein [Artemisia annua]|uniref:Protein kinase-like domain-containing protein n=1 Tax=Artemisia annua TaxID=35608 RepID=A0A2U1P9G5_ARTAN|nr:protein kinase-like domain-containing protein [Artemisia annua]